MSVRSIGMATRKDLIQVLRPRYLNASRAEKTKILNEFVLLTGFHRKHAIRALNQPPSAKRPVRQRERYYDETVVAELITLWEASDRLCGKRLKALIPILIDAMQRHGHCTFDPLVEQKLLEISAATIDRALAPIRQKINGHGRRRNRSSSVIRRAVPIRTFTDWGNPPPGYFEVDMVEHCGGPKKNGNFVHSLVLTDIASGWTECIALPARNHAYVIRGITQTRKQIPFVMHGIDTDNDSAFMNHEVFAYCKSKELELTRSRAYKKNDQAWVEQKNGSVVRRLVGYGRLLGNDAARALARLYRASRLYINFFQPSFKLKTKHRAGARVYKTYHSPKTPYERLLESPAIDSESKRKLKKQFELLDPVLLLHEIRQAQKKIVQHGTTNLGKKEATSSDDDLKHFLNGLASLWHKGEARPTHRKAPKSPRWWRTRKDPFEHAWPLIDSWLEDDPALNSREIMDKLIEAQPEQFPNDSAMRTLQRRLKARREKEMLNLMNEEN